jgi:DNA-binding transcriptional ArsR family regulator
MADDEQGEDGALSPEDAFGLLGHEVRLGIVRELATVRRANWQWQGLTFAQLRKAVGVRDAGNFSYHLGKLRDHFVVKDGDEYKLTYAGMEVAGAVISGTYTDKSEPRRETSDVDCFCGEPLTVEYEREFFAMECPDHGTIFGTTLPPGAAQGRSVEEIVSLATLDARQEVERARAECCPHCWGPMSTALPAQEVVDPDTGETLAVPDDEVYVRFDCGRCGMQFWLPPGACVLSDPAVVSFLHENGVVVDELSYPELPFVSPEAATVISEDPVRVRVDVEADERALQVWIDEGIRIVETERP